MLTVSDVLACVSIYCADQKQQSNPDFLKKSIDNTLQTCVDIANEYLQAYKTSTGVKSHVFCSLRQCKCAGYTLFLITCLIELTFSKLKSKFLHGIRLKQYLQSGHKVIDFSCSFFLVSLCFKGRSFLLWFFHKGCNVIDICYSFFAIFLHCYSQVATIFTFVWHFLVGLMFGRRHRALSYLNTMRN